MKLAFLLLFLIALAGFAMADNCADVLTNLSTGYPAVMNESCTTGWSGTYYVKSASSSTGALTLGDNNLVIDCKGGGLTGNGTGYGMHSINKNNISFLNCNISSYNINLLFQGANPFIVNKTVLSNSTNENIFVQGVNNGIFDSVTAVGGRTASFAHGLYISNSYVTPSTSNITVKNGNFSNNGGSGIYVNSYNSIRAYNVNVSNNYISGNVDGIADRGCKDCQFFNNSLVGNTRAFFTGQDDNFRNGSFNTQFYHNNLKSTSEQEIIISYGTTNVSIFNNTYQGLSNVWIRNNASINGTSISIIENTTGFFNISYDSIYSDPKSAVVSLNYGGVKNITINNNAVLLNNIGYNYSIFNITSGKAVLNNNATALLTVGAGESYTVTLSSASGGCDYPFENMTIATSTTLCAGSYNLYDVNNNGAIFFMANNKVLNCDGTKIIGNWTGRGISNNGYDNITVKNCMVINYPQGLYSEAYNQNNTFISNIIINSTTAGIDSYATRLGITNFVAYNNTIIGNYSGDGIRVQHGVRANISSNNITKHKYGIEFTNVSSANVYLNSFYNNGIAIVNNKGTFNNFSSNNIDLSDSCISLWNVTYTRITYNNLTNCTAGNDGYFDGYYTAIRNEYNSDNNIISNNNIWTYGTIGLLIRQSRNITVIANDFKQIDINMKRPLAIADREPSAAIAILELYQGYLGDSSESNSDTISHISFYNSSNISISGNSFDTNVQTYLLIQGANNIKHDLSNYWYRKFQVPVYLVDSTEFYNNNLFDKLTCSIANYPTRPLPTVIENMTIGYPAIYIDATKMIVYTISKTTMTFTNVNKTTSYNLSLFNLTDQGYPYVDIFLSNQTSHFLRNVKEANLTLYPNNSTRVIFYNHSNWLNALPTTITDINMTYASNILNVSCSGSGAITVNLTSIKGSVGTTIYHNGNYVEQTGLDTYTTNGSCSSWAFEPYSEVVLGGGGGGTIGASPNTVCSKDEDCYSGYRCENNYCTFGAREKPANTSFFIPFTSDKLIDFTPFYKLINTTETAVLYYVETAKNSSPSGLHFWIAFQNAVKLYFYNSYIIFIAAVSLVIFGIVMITKKKKRSFSN